MESFEEADLTDNWKKKKPKKPKVQEKGTLSIKSENEEKEKLTKEDN